MTYYQEKVFFGFSGMISSGICGLGAIITGGEGRWIFITLAVALFTSTFLSLLCRKADESIKVVVGRSGLTILLAIFGSRLLVCHLRMVEQAEKDVLLLGGLAFGISVIAYSVGHSFIKTLDRSGNRISDRILGWVLRGICGDEPPPPKN